MAITYPVKSTHILQNGKNQNPKVQRAMSQAGLLQGRKEQKALSQNPYLPTETWFELYKLSRTKTVRRNLVDRRLNKEQKKFVVENETNSEVLETFVNKNTLSREHSVILLNMNKARVTVALGLKNLHGKTDTEQMRQQLYNADSYPKAALVLGALNLEELSQNSDQPAETLKSSTEINIENTFKLLNTLSSKPKEYRVTEYNFLALLLSSNPIYADHLHLIEETETNQLTVANYLARSVLQQPTERFLERLYDKLDTFGQRQINQVLNQNPTLSKALRNKIVNTTGNIKEQTAGEDLYRTKNKRKLQNLTADCEENIGGRGANISTLLVAKSRLKALNGGVEPAKTTEKIVLKRDAWRDIQREHTLHMYNLNFAWGPVPKPRTVTYSYTSYRDARRKELLDNLMREAEKTLQDNTTAWQYWFGIGWDSNSEAERNLDLALQLAKTEQNPTEQNPTEEETQT